MAVGTINISLRAEYKKAAYALARFGKSLDARQLLEAIGAAHLFWINENLRQAGLEAPHHPMSPNTIAARPLRTSNRHFSSRWRHLLAQSFVNDTVLQNMSIDVGTNDEYAPYHHHGTGPYTIVPVQAKMLRFKTVHGTVFARKVDHPGIPARPLIPTKQVAERLAVNVVTAVIDKARNEYMAAR